MLSAFFRGKIVTIPNLLTVLRLLLIPVFMWSYLAKEDVVLTAVLLALSGVTDLADGFIARRFNMVSDLGKALDPLADKLTQVAVIVCLIWRFPRLIVLLAVVCLKELAALITTLAAIRKTDRVYSAAWHGKAATVAIYLTILVHLIWPGITSALSAVLIGLCALLVLLSGVLYILRNIRLIRQDSVDLPKEAS